jgi:hypothetical protein
MTLMSFQFIIENDEGPWWRFLLMYEEGRRRFSYRYIANSEDLKSMDPKQKVTDDGEGRKETCLPFLFLSLFLPHR